MYNAFKRIKGIIYCLKCVPKETVMIVHTAELDFAEFEKAVKSPGIIISTPEKEELKILTVCKYCGCRGSSEWLELPNGEWCCKRKGCRKKFHEEFVEE